MKADKLLIVATGFGLDAVLAPEPDNLVLYFDGELSLDSKVFKPDVSDLIEFLLQKGDLTITNGWAVLTHNNDNVYSSYEISALDKLLEIALFIIDDENNGIK